VAAVAEVDPVVRALAIWGAVVSTIAFLLSVVALAWTVVRDLTERRVRVMVMPHVPREGGGYKLKLWITNTGRRDVTISACHLKLEGKGWRQVLAKELPMTLAEGRSGDVVCAPLEGLSAEVVGAKAIDSVGKTWTASGRKTRRMMEDTPELIRVLEKEVLPKIRK
jgi:hypothetical protein